MKTKVFTLAALLCCASAMYAQESGYKFTTVASQENNSKSKIRPLPELAGALPPLRSWNPNCSVWAKGNMIFLKCSLYAKST